MFPSSIEMCFIETFEKCNQQIHIKDILKAYHRYINSHQGRVFVSLIKKSTNNFEQKQPLRIYEYAILIETVVKKDVVF